MALYICYKWNFNMDVRYKLDERVEKMLLERRFYRSPVTAAFPYVIDEESSKIVRESFHGLASEYIRGEQMIGLTDIFLDRTKSENLWVRMYFLGVSNKDEFREIMKELETIHQEEGFKHNWAQYFDSTIPK